jgi:hypothetical protein
MASVDLSHVDKIYTGEIKAVDDFTLNIADREFIVFVGRWILAMNLHRLDCEVFYGSKRGAQ